MRIEVYAERYTRTDEETRLGLVFDLAVLGYPVTWSLIDKPGRIKVTLNVADGSKVWADGGKVWIDEGNGAGVLRTVNGMPTLTIVGYYGAVDKVLRIASIAK